MAKHNQNYQISLQNRIKRTFRSKTFDIYEVVGENVGDEIVGEFQKSSKRFKSNNQEQYRTRNGADNHVDSEDSFESQDHKSGDLDISDRVNYIRMVVVSHKYFLYSVIHYLLSYEGSN